MAKITLDSLPELMLSTLSTFVFYFFELSFLFLGISMLVAFINQRFANLIQKELSQNSLFSYLKAIMLGALTPFCSCSTIPFFLSLLRSKIPLSVSFSYLLTSPLINPILLTMLFVYFGAKITLLYSVFIVLSVFICSFVLTYFKEESLLETSILDSNHTSAQNHPQIFLQNPPPKPHFIKANSPLSTAPFSATSFNAPKSCCQSNMKALSSTKACCQSATPPHQTNFQAYQSPIAHNTSQSKINLLKPYWEQSLKDYTKILPYLIVGMGIGAFLHGFVPQGSLESLKDFDLWAVPLASLISIFLYMRVESLIPIGIELMNAGLPLGIVMSMLIAGGGCSLPEVILLKSLFKPKLLFIFVAQILGIAILFGYVALIFF